jgi:preprotein translocase subunit SecB
MSDETADQPAADEQQPQAGGQPTLVVNAQYVKDLSFENPNAPHSLLQQSGEPNVQVGVDTTVVKLEGSTYEVTLTVRAEGTAGETTLFMVEAAYAGVFTLGETPEEYIAPMLYVEAPRQLFPFARAVVAECVRDGGFPPLLIHPVDFMALFQQRAQQAAEQTATEGSSDSSPDGNGEQKFEFEL